MALFVGTDIGGTFTDLVGYDSTCDAVFFGKTLTTAADLVNGVTSCLAEVGIAARSVDVLKHGTTQIINTLLERSGARTALVITEGFRDIVEIGRASRPLAFQLDYQRSPPLIPAPLRLELRERIRADGTVLEPLQDEELERLAAKLGTLGVSAVAISLLNAYRNPCHETRTAEFLRRRFPGVFISAGTELSREWFEYERTCTAMANAFVGPRAAEYLGQLERTLDDQAFRGRLFIMSSNGGVLSLAQAKNQPISLVESGPIGGCIGAATYARTLGLQRLIAFDMGGTTAKCALIEDLRFEVSPTYDVGGYEYGFPIRTPVLDIAEVGTGGGSIAHVDESGALHVGPRSAGSEPGPVCFGRGGTEPTVTDADLALDRIASGAFLRGALPLDRDASRHAIDHKIGRPLGYAAGQSIDQLAQGILDLANVQMASAIKEITVERGRDVRDFELFAFGGGGPMHAVSLARELRIPRVIVPPQPGNFSALGMLFADSRIEEARTVLLKLREDDEALLRKHADEIKAVLLERLHRELDAVSIVFESVMEMRFEGQRHSIKISLHDSDKLADIRSRFFDEYRRRYGFVDEAATIELVNMRVAGIAVSDKPDLAGLHQAGSEGRPEPRDYRDVFFGESARRVRTPIYSRNTLPIGASIQGPAVIEEFGATTVLGPYDRLVVGSLGELTIELQATLDNHGERPNAITVCDAQNPLQLSADLPDPITAEIITHSLCAIPNVIDKNITRTAYSVLVSEYKDFAVGIVDAEARLVSQCKGGLPVFVANALSAAVKDGLKLFGKSDLQTGDVILTNAAATMGQHLNNVVMYTPIRVAEDDDGLVGFMAIVVHWMDVGGNVVGSCTTTKSTEVFQEGIQFPSLKLLQRGKRSPEIYRLVEANTRFTELVLGDMESQLAGCMMGRDMVLEVVNKFGRSAVRAAIDMFWKRSETTVRNAIRAIPEGVYEASSFLDDDGIHRDKTLPVNVKILVEGDQLTVDLSGLANQVAGPWNAGFQGGAVAAVRIACKFFFSSDEPANDGAFRPIKIVCRPGTIMSATPNAAIAGSGHNLPTVVDTILRALGKAVPEKVPAGHPGTYSAQIIVDRRAGSPGGYHLEAVAGGWGAGHNRDGNGPFRSMAHGDTPEVPIELQEATYPYRMKRMRLRIDSGGVGKYRGGLGIEKVYELLGPVDYIAMFDRTKCPPWGVAGGGDGKPGRVDIVRAGKFLRSVTKDDLTLQAGDEIHLFSAGGGGYGSPLERPIAKVVEDARSGYVSAASAANDYGIALDDELRPTELPCRRTT
jgi:N-methylhydantoinase A/oxoprolinase/acetone carboxylase beta subunit/N-methylhydantoinase B/oxoprolinase/acetone carboxylase alpha subunit